MALIQVPVTATPEEQRAFQQIDEFLSRMFGGFNVDFNGRRVINAGDAQAAQDYVTRADVVRMIRAAGLSINNDGSPIGSEGQAVQVRPQSSVGSAQGSSLANELARVSLRA